MKRLLLSLILLSCASDLCLAQASNTVSIVEIVGWDGCKTYQALSQEDYNAARNAAVVTNRLMPKALALAKDEWKSDMASTSGVFPSGVASAIKIKSMEVVRKDLAEKRVRELTAKLPAEEGEKLSGREKQLELIRGQLENLRKNTTLNDRDRDIRIKKAEQTFFLLENDLAERKAKAAKRLDNLKQAQDIFRVKLTQVASEDAEPGR